MGAANPHEIARNVLLQLSARRLAPTPQNFSRLYAELSGEKPEQAGHDFPEKAYRALANALSPAAHDMPALSRSLEAALQKHDAGAFQGALADHLQGLERIRRLSWGPLIEKLLQQWETHSAGITHAQKRESLKRLLAHSSEPQSLFSRLSALQEHWHGAGVAPPPELPEALPAEAPPEKAEAPLQAGMPGRMAEWVPEIRNLLSEILGSLIAPFFAHDTRRTKEVAQLSAAVQAASTYPALLQLKGGFKHLDLPLAQVRADEAERAEGLARLLGQVFSNIGELALDDPWMKEQMLALSRLIDRPAAELTPAMLDELGERLKDVIVRQSSLKGSLKEARESLRELLAGFVDHLSDFAGETSGYQEKLAQHLASIHKAERFGELENVMQALIADTHAIEIKALQSRDELSQARERVANAEKRIEKLEAELAETAKSISRDPLTGVLNRRGLDAAWAREASRNERQDSPLCLSLLDIDDFKKLNDSLGHEAGDEALKHITQVVRDTLRPQDTVARFGGEEFVILLPGTRAGDAVQAMQRVQRELTRRFFLHDNQKLLITFSAGVAERRTGEDQKTLTRRADEAMYDAKNAGKNRVALAG